jgi:hypothetical protein
MLVVGAAFGWRSLALAVGGAMLLALRMLVKIAGSLVSRVLPPDGA